MAADAAEPILVVDHADLTVRIARGVLAQLGVAQVDEASSCGAALHKLKARRYRAILADGGAQAELVRAAACDPALRLAPIIPLQARSVERLKARLSRELEAL